MWRWKSYLSNILSKIYNKVSNIFMQKIVEIFFFLTPYSVSHGSFLDWKRNWHVQLDSMVNGRNLSLASSCTIFLSLEFRVGDTCSTKRKSRRRRRRSESAPNATTLLCVCVLCYAPQLLEEEEVWLLPRESGSRPHDYTRDPCRSKGHAHNRDHGGIHLFLINI